MNFGNFLKVYMQLLAASMYLMWYCLWRVQTHELRNRNKLKLVKKKKKISKKINILTLVSPKSQNSETFLL